MTTFADHMNTIMGHTAPAVSRIEDDAPSFLCADCRTEQVAVADDLCPRCTKEKTLGYRIMNLIGRAANGMHLDSGTRNHAVPFNDRKAMCGAKPGRRSAGWSDYHGDDVTCPRCLARLSKVAK